MTSLLRAFAAALAIGIMAGTCVWVAQRRAAEERIDAFARGYEQGLTDGMRVLEVAPADPDVSCARRVAELEDELEGCAECADAIADYRRTEAANRANARALGLNEGLRIGREDWYACGAWERERFR